MMFGVPIICRTNKGFFSSLDDFLIKKQERKMGKRVFPWELKPAGKLRKELVIVSPMKADTSEYDIYEILFPKFEGRKVLFSSGLFESHSWRGSHGKHGRKKELPKHHRETIRCAHA